MSERPSTPSEFVVIWRGEHRGYWGPNRAGYFDYPKSGIYTREEAEHLIQGAGPEKRLEIRTTSQARETHEDEATQ